MWAIEDGRRCLLLIACSVLAFWPGGAYAVAQIPAKASIVVNTATGEVLHADNVDRKIQPASLAKMMTLHLLFKKLKERGISFNTRMRVSKNATMQRPSVLGLKEGEQITCRDAVLAQITKSANDVSIVIAEHLAGSVENFVKTMNKEARALGMNATTFVNPSGWKNDRQLTTARDIARLSMAIQREHPRYFKLFSTGFFKYKGKTYQNHNSLLGKRAGMAVDGIKTGYVQPSGLNVAVSAQKEGKRLVAVVLGEPSAKKRDAKVEQLLSCAFDKISRRRHVPRKRPTTGLIKMFRLNTAKADAIAANRKSKNSVANPGPQRNGLWNK